MDRFQQKIRVVLPIVFCWVLLAPAFLLMAFFWQRGEPSWGWVILLCLLGLCWVAAKQKLHSWVSPRAFLFSAVPFLLILFITTLALPGFSGPGGISGGRSPQWSSSERGTAVDLSGEFRTLDGKPFSLQDFQGRLLLVNLWATWCGPCRMEMPDIAVLSDKLSGEGLKIVAVTDENPKVVRRFLESNPVPFTVVIDRRHTLVRRFRVRAIPTTLVVDRQQQLVFRHVGAFRWGSPNSIEHFRQLLSK